MRICPLCQATYEDDIEFCFKDGTPLDEVGSGEDDAGSSEEEFSIHDSVEFMPPDAIALTGEIEVPDTDPPDDDGTDLPEDAPLDEDGGIKVVPGGLTSPLDDEESIEAPDPFAMPHLEPGADVLAMVSGEFPARQPETMEAEQPDLSEDEESAGVPETVEDGGYESEDEGEEPPEEPPVEEEAEQDAGPPPPPEIPEDDDTPVEEEEDDDAPAAPAWLDEVEDPAGPAAEPPKPDFEDPLYASIVPAEKARKKGMIWWIVIGTAALLAIAFLAYSLATKGNRGGEIDPGDVTLTVDNTPEERPTARPPVEPPTPEDGITEEDATEGLEEDATEGLEEDATEGLEEDVTEAPEEPTPPEEPPTEAPTEEPPTEAPDRPEPPTPEPPTPAPVEPADPSNPWVAAATNPTADQPADPSNPWAAAANATQNGKMTVSSTPVGATFYVDNQRKGTTPLTVDVPFGHHNVRVEKDGHVAQERPVSVQSGTVFVDFTLEKTAAPATGKLTVFTNPQPGATLYVDGAARGKTPVTLDITPGVHTLRVELAGFPTKEETIDLSDLQPGENRRRVISME